MARLKALIFYNGCLRLPVLLMCVLLVLTDSTFAHASEIESTVDIQATIEDANIENTPIFLETTNQVIYFYAYDPNGNVLDTVSKTGTNTGTYSFTVPEGKTVQYILVSYTVDATFDGDYYFKTNLTGTVNRKGLIYKRSNSFVGTTSASNTGYIEDVSFAYNSMFKCETGIDVDSSISRVRQMYRVWFTTAATAGSTIKLTDFTFTDSLVDVEEQNSKGILETLKSIFSSIANLPTKIKEALSSLFQSIVDAVNDAVNAIKVAFTDLFSSWFQTDAELDSSVSDGSGVIDDVGSAESDLIADALDDINGLDFDAGFSTDLIAAMLWVVPFQDRLFNGLGMVKDVIVVSLTVGLVTLLLGRGLRALGNYSSSPSSRGSDIPKMKGGKKD